MGAIKDTCLCGFHVHSGTRIIRWLTIIFNALLTAWYIFAAVRLTQDDVRDYLAEEHAKANGASKDGPGALDFAEKVKLFIIVSSIIGVVTFVFQILLTAVMLYGLERKRPGLYIPYLTYMLFQIILQAFFTVFSLIVTVRVLVDNPEDENNRFNTNWKIGFAVYNLVMIASLLCMIYFRFIVVKRSRSVLLKEAKGNFGQIVPVASTLPYHEPYRQN